MPSPCTAIESYLHCQSSEFVVDFFIKAIKTDQPLIKYEQLLTERKITFDKIVKTVQCGQLLDDYAQSINNLSQFFWDITQHPAASPIVTAFRKLSHTERICQFQDYKSRKDVNHQIYQCLENLYSESTGLFTNILFLLEYYVLPAMSFTMTASEQSDFLSALLEKMKMSVNRGTYFVAPDVAKVDKDKMTQFAFILNELGWMKYSSTVNQFLLVIIKNQIPLCGFRNKYLFLSHFQQQVEDTKWDRLKNAFGGNKETPTEIRKFRTTLENFNTAYRQALNGNPSLLNQIFIDIGTILEEDRGYFTHSSETAALYAEYKEKHRNLTITDTLPLNMTTPTNIRK